jgi:hypothetical protein
MTGKRSEDEDEDEDEDADADAAEDDGLNAPTKTRSDEVTERKE